jgi:hypothetical protein
LEGTTPSLCASFRQRLLSSFDKTLFRLVEGSTTLIDRLEDQSTNAFGTAIAGSGFEPSVVFVADVTTAKFDGNDAFTNFADAYQIIQATQFYMIIRFKVSTIDTDEEQSWDNDTMMGDASRYLGIGLRQPNLVVFHLDDTIAADNKIEVPFILGAWQTAEMYFDGVAFHGRVNGGVWTSHASGILTDLTGGWRLGRGLAGTEFKGEISDFAVYNTQLSNTLRNKIQAELAT